MKKFWLFAGVLAQAFLPMAHASVILSGTRFIFHGNQESLSFRVLNQDDKDYLVLTKILCGNTADNRTETHQEGATGEPVFIATPPLFRLNAKHENSVRITRVGGGLPSDRESLFWLSVASIPSTERHAQNNTLQIAVRSKMKLFYRPSGLNADPASAYKKITLARSGNAIRVANPTPYYITLVNVTAAGKRVGDPPMLAPFSSLTQNWCAAQNNCLIQWQAINDYGSIAPTQHKSID